MHKILAITIAIMMAMPPNHSLRSGAGQAPQAQALRPMAGRISGRLSSFLAPIKNHYLINALCVGLDSFHDMKSTLGNKVQWHLRVKKAVDVIQRKCGSRREAKRILLQLETVYKRRIAGLSDAKQRALFLESVKTEVLSRGIWRKRKLRKLLNRPEDYLANITEHTLPSEYMPLQFSCPWPVDLSYSFVHNFHGQDILWLVPFIHHSGIDICTKPGAVVRNVMKGGVVIVNRGSACLNEVGVIVYSPQHNICLGYGHLDKMSLSEKIQKAILHKANVAYDYGDIPPEYRVDDKSVYFFYADNMYVELDEGEYIARVAQWSPDDGTYQGFPDEIYRYFSYKLFGPLISHLHLDAFVNVYRRPKFDDDLTKYPDIDPLLLLKNLYPIAKDTNPGTINPFPPVSQSKIKTIFFDIGNVILFYDWNKAAFNLSQYCDVPQEKIYEILTDKNLRFPFEQGAITPERYYEIISKKLELSIDYDTFAKAFSEMFEVNSAVVEIIQQLKALGYKIGIITNINPIHKQYVLDTYKDIFVMADFYVVSCDVGTTKPHKYIYEIALSRAGIKPEEAIFIDDILENAEGASLLGIDAIQYLSDANLQKFLKVILESKQARDEAGDGLQGTTSQQKISAAIAEAA